MIFVDKRTGITMSGKSEFVALFAQAHNKYEQELEKWVSELKECNIHAAHPNDGWVDRERLEVQLCYPYFVSPIFGTGSLVALGIFKEYKLVKIVGHRKNMFDTDIWRFQYL